MIEPVDADIGRLVFYRAGHPTAEVEAGHITSFNERCVFVRYMPAPIGAGGDGTHRKDLFWTREEAEART